MYTWKDRYDNYYLPSEMTNQHLVYTLRMIWNHSAPKFYRMQPYKPYTFTKFYTNEYMKQSIKHLAKELSTRENLTLKEQYIINFIALNSIKLKQENIQCLLT
jgi:hypothetical protein